MIYYFVTEENRENLSEKEEEEFDWQNRQRQLEGKRYAAESHVIQEKIC